MRIYWLPAFATLTALTVFVLAVGLLPTFEDARQRVACLEFNVSEAACR